MTAFEVELLEMPSPSFKVPPLDLKLTADEIHIWFAVLDHPASRLHRFIQTLSTEERTRADHFCFERDRKSFIVRRGLLRTILGFYLNVAPSRLRFRCAKDGKPELMDISGKESVHFSLSHSEGAALFGFARDREIGVDIEYMRDISEMDQIAEQFFSIKENEVFRSLPKSQKREAFFRGWTCKEAFIKALGEGLSRPLDGFDVSLVPGEPAKLLGIEGDSKEASRWSIQELKPALGFATALAVEGNNLAFRCWQWSNLLIETHRS
jgi:4'-phosphopantetheinyl transferase